jgi:hypothetical protein
MPDLETALRLALHLAGRDDLLPADDYGDDLYDHNLMRDEITDDETYCVATPDGADLLRAAAASPTRAGH